jgi:uncharacterized protein YndB with AHSA1/START domain
MGGGPGEIKATRGERDARVGGRYRIVMHSPDGEDHDVGSVYRDLVANKSLVTVLFKPDGGGAVLTLTYEQFFDEEARADNCR